MGSVFRPYRTKIDPETGERVRVYCRKWYVKYRDADGIIRKVPGFTDKAATEHLCADLEKKAAREAVGIVDRFADERKRPLSEHLKDYKTFLQSKANTEKHVGLTIGRIDALIDGCDFVMIGDISAARVMEWLAEQRKPTKDKKGLSHQTSNFYLTAMKGFVRWLVRERRTGENPLEHLTGLNVKTDRRHDRRAISERDFGKLIEAARNGEPFQGLSGPDRAVLYQLAANSGLRASELASLSAASLLLDAEQATVTVQAAYSKHRREDVLPLRGDVAAMLRAWLQEKAQEPRGEAREGSKVIQLKTGPEKKTPTLLWPGKWLEDPAEMLRRDLAKAGIAYQDAAGLFFDFHSLRHQFITTLTRSRVHPKEAQILARHSTIQLTMDRYTHLGLVDARDALENLPPLPGAVSAEPEQAKATGTEGDVGKKYGPGYGPAPDALRPSSSLSGNEDEDPEEDDKAQKPKQEGQLAQPVADCPEKTMVSPTGFEPVACGLGILFDPFFQVLTRARNSQWLHEI